jgi:hypothetical protein
MTRVAEGGGPPDGFAVPCGDGNGSRCHGSVASRMLIAIKWSRMVVALTLTHGSFSPSCCQWQHIAARSHCLHVIATRVSTAKPANLRLSPGLLASVVIASDGQVDLSESASASIFPRSIPPGCLSLSWGFTNNISLSQLYKCNAINSTALYAFFDFTMLEVTP